MKSLLDDAHSQSQSGYGESTVSASNVSSSTYAEMIEEVEKVTEELLQTQEKLWETEDSLKNSDIQVKTLKTRLSDKERVFKDVRIIEEENCTLIDRQQTLRDEIDFLKGELAERDKYPGRPEAERRLKKAVDFLKKDLEKSKEKYRASEHKMKELQSRVQRMDDLEALVERMQSGTKTREDEMKCCREQMNEEMECCREQMNEAREESTNLVEEVATLQKELREAKTDNKNREHVLEERVTKQVKERLTMTVRENTTKQVTQKVTREVKTEMKAERDKDLNALREQFKKIFKDNSVLKAKLQTAESSVADTKKLEEEIPKLKYEISGLVDALEQTKKEQEVAFGELESFFRVKVQAVREQAAKDKWDHAAEIRHQMAKERDFEVKDFSRRFEALSRETEVLLDEAAREKERYAAEIRKQFTEEKQRGVSVLMKRINELSRGSEAFLKKAAEDKEAYAEQIRKQMQEEKQREVNKYTYRLEALKRENEALQRRIDSFEEDQACTWKESESNADLLKTAQTNLKASEDSILRLKRKNQNLNTLVDRYKEDHAEASKELALSNKLFKESLIKSEEKIVKMSEKIKRLESSSEKLKRVSSEASVELDRSKNHSTEALEASEKESARLKENNKNLNSLLDKWKTEHSEALKKLDQFKKYSKRVLHASDNEITILKKENQQLSSLLDKWRSNDPDISETLDQTKHHFKEKMKTSDEKMVRLKEENKSLNSLLEELNDSLNMVSVEKLKLAEKMLQMETSLHKRNNELEEFQRSKQSVKMSEGELTRFEGENIKLKTSLEAQLDSQNKIAVEQKEETGGYEQSTWSLVGRIEDLKFSLDRYRGNNPESGHTPDLNREIKTLNDLLARHKSKCFDASKNLKQVDKAAPTSEEEVVRLNNEIQSLRGLADRSRQHQSETSTEKDSLRIDDNIRSESSQVYELNERIQSLTSVLEQAKNEHSETLRDLEYFQDENSRLEGKVKDLDYMLAKYRNEHAQMSKELEKSRQLLASDKSDVLKEKVLSLNILVEKNKTERIEIFDELDRSRRKCKEVVDASEKSGVQFKGQIQNLNSLLAKSKSDLLASDESDMLKEKVLRLNILVEKNKTERIEILDELDRSRRECKGVVDASEKSGVQFKGQIQNLNSLLAKSKSDLLASDESGILKEKVLSLNILVEKNKTERIEILDELDRARRKCKEVVDASEKSGVQFKGQIQNLNSLLAKSKSDHFEVLEELHVSRQRLNTSMEASANEVLQLRERYNQVESLLDRSKGGESKLSEELLHSKRLFNEALVKSEDTIFNLKEQVRGLNSELKITRDDNFVAKSQLEQHALDSQTIADLKEKMDNLEFLLETSRNENLQLSKHLETSNQEFRLSLAASEGEADRFKETIHNLKTTLDKYKTENSKISKELEHSMQLFKEALVAWREETRVLREELALEKRSKEDVSKYAEDIDEKRRNIVVEDGRPDRPQVSQGWMVPNQTDSFGLDYFATTVESTRQLSTDATLTERNEDPWGHVTKSHADSEDQSTIVSEAVAETRDSPDTHKVSVYRDVSGEHREGDVTSESSMVSQQVSDMRVSRDSSDGPILNPVLDSNATEEESVTSQTLRGEMQAQKWKEETRRLIEEVESSKKYQGNAAIDSRETEDVRDYESENFKLITPFEAKKNLTEQEVPSVPHINETGALEKDDVSIASESTTVRVETAETSQVVYPEARDQNFDCRSRDDEETQESRNEDTTVDSYSNGKSRPEQARIGREKRVTWKNTMTEFEGDKPKYSGIVTGSIVSTRSILKENKDSFDRPLVVGWEHPIDTHDGSSLTHQDRMESEADTLVENATMDDTIASASKEGESEIRRQNEYPEMDSNVSDFEEAIRRNKRDSFMMDQSNRSAGIQRNGFLADDLSSSSADSEDDQEDQDAGDDATDSLAETTLDDMFWPENTKFVRWNETNDLFDPNGPIHEDDVTEDEMVQSTASNMDTSEEGPQDTREMISLEESNAEILELAVKKDDEGDEEDGTIFSEGPQSSIGDYTMEEIDSSKSTSDQSQENSPDDPYPSLRDDGSMLSQIDESWSLRSEEREAEDQDGGQDDDTKSGGQYQENEDDEQEDNDSQSSSSWGDSGGDFDHSHNSVHSEFQSVNGAVLVEAREDSHQNEGLDDDAKSGDQYQEDEDIASQNISSWGDRGDDFDNTHNSVHSEFQSENGAVLVEAREDSHFQRPTETRQESTEFARDEDQPLSREDQLSTTTPTSVSENSEMRFSSVSSFTISDRDQLDTDTLDAAADTILNHFEFPESSPKKLFLPSNSFTPPSQRGIGEEQEMAPVDEHRELGDEGSDCSSVESRDMMMNVGDDWQDENTTAYEEDDDENSTTNSGQDVDEEEDTLFTTTEQSVNSEDTDRDDITLDTATEKILLGEAADQVIHQFRMDTAAVQHEYESDSSRFTGASSEVRTKAESLDSAVDVSVDVDESSAETTSERREAISGFHRSLERVSRRQWSRRDIRRFCYRKSSSKKTPPSSPSITEMAQQPFEAVDTTTTTTTSEKAGETEALDFRSLVKNTTSMSSMLQSEEEGTLDSDEASVLQILPAQSE